MNEKYRVAGNTLILFLDSEHPCPSPQQATPSLKTQKTLGPQKNTSQRRLIDATKHSRVSSFREKLGSHLIHLEPWQGGEERESYLISVN